jgi:gas vesicle protein
MAFEIISFLIGVAVGGLVGGLAAILHGLERVADLQERVRQVTRDLQRLKDSDPMSRDQKDNDPKRGLDDLQRDLDEINAEIRRMYKRT